MAVWLLFKQGLSNIDVMSSDNIIRLHKNHQKPGLLLKQSTSLPLLDNPKMLMKLQAADQTQTEHHPERGCGLWSPAALSQSTDGAVWRLYLFIYSLDTLDIILTSHQFYKFSVLTTDYCDCMLYDCDKAKISCIFKMSCFLTY